LLLDAAGIIIPALVKVAIADAQVTRACLATNHQT